MQKQKAFSPCRDPNAILPRGQSLPRPRRKLPFLEGGGWRPKASPKGSPKTPQKVGVQKCPQSLRSGPLWAAKITQTRAKRGFRKQVQKRTSKSASLDPSGPSKCGRRLSESLSGTFQPGPTTGTKRAPKSDPKRSQNLTKPCSEATTKEHSETGTEK